MLTSAVTAFRWMGEGNRLASRWGSQWTKLHTLKLHSGITLTEESEFCDVARYAMAYREALITGEMLRFWRRESSKATGRAGSLSWVDVQRDDWTTYQDLWRSARKENERKRTALDALGSKEFVHENQLTRPPGLDGAAAVDDVEIMSVWDQ